MVIPGLGPRGQVPNSIDFIPFFRQNRKGHQGGKEEACSVVKNLSKLNRGRIYTGVVLLCTAVLLMLMEKEESPPLRKVVWISLLTLGIIFYLWGRFFSRGED